MDKLVKTTLSNLRGNSLLCSNPMLEASITNFSHFFLEINFSCLFRVTVSGVVNEDSSIFFFFKIKPSVPILAALKFKFSQCCLT